MASDWVLVLIGAGATLTASLVTQLLAQRHERRLKAMEIEAALGGKLLDHEYARLRKAEACLYDIYAWVHDDRPFEDRGPAMDIKPAVATLMADVGYLRRYPVIEDKTQAFVNLAMNWTKRDPKDLSSEENERRHKDADAMSALIEAFRTESDRLLKHGFRPPAGPREAR